MDSDNVDISITLGLGMELLQFNKGEHTLFNDSLSGITSFEVEEGDKFDSVDVSSSFGDSSVFNNSSILGDSSIMEVSSVFGSTSVEETC